MQFDFRYSDKRLAARVFSPKFDGPITVFDEKNRFDVISMLMIHEILTIS